MNTPDVLIPAAFWDDHLDRMPYDDERDCPQTLERRGRRVLIRATDAGLRGLLADVRYYANPENMDECPRYLRESAKRTVAALARIGGAA